jgi:hypothetical protein
MFKVEPYLPGRGPIVEFRPDDDTWRNGVVVSTDPYTKNTTERFTWTGYRPGLSARTERDYANDIVGFAMAYVDRPEEFDRSPDDTEQLCDVWWMEHGDVIACETGDDADA